MKSSTRSMGAEFAVQEGDPKFTSTLGTLVVVKVKDYRYISQGIGGIIYPSRPNVVLITPEKYLNQ